ncbi:hypothetical protein AYK24_02400 [Thermoplasmatales archaeon SG8-52-4]|nr:MAG: hypothetical protein AYK24_02400 [Thermoplasmatales archaeon SG8-52-4]
MKEEPDIVKELRNEEKFGLLEGFVKGAIEGLGAPNTSVDNNYNQRSCMKEKEGGTNKNEDLDIKEKYQTIFENYTIAITLADNHERVISWNKYAEELLNMNEKELYLIPVRSLYPEDEWQKIRSENIRQKGIKYRMETRMIRKNQGLLDVEVSLCVLKGKNGKIAGSVGIIKDITRLKEAERELKTSEEKYRTIFENSAVALTLTDEKERIISWNKCTENILGMNEEDLYLKPVKNLYPKEEWKKIRSKNIRQKGLQYHLETKVLNKNNETVDVDLSLSVLKDFNGKIIGSIGVLQDISTYKNMEKNLKESLDKFRDLAEESPNMIFINKKGKIIYANKKCEELMGYKRKDFYSPKFNFLKLIVPEYRDLILKNFKKHAEGKNIRPYEYALITKNGNRIEAIIATKLIKYDNDPAILGIITDITDRKYMEEKLRESEWKYRTVFENANDEIIYIDNSGTIIDINKKVKEVLGYNPKDLLGKKFNKLGLVTLKDLPKLTKIFKNVILKGKSIDKIELEIKNKNGSVNTLEASVNPVVKNGKTVGLLSVVRDITERKQLEKKLYRQNEINALRANIWEQAVNINSEEKLIKKLLEKIGKFLNVDKASFLRINHQKKMVISEIQWKKSGKIKQTKINIPYWMVKRFFGKSHLVFDLKNIPTLAKPIVSPMFKKYNLKSSLIIPYGDIDYPSGYFTADDCKIQREWKEDEIALFSEVSRIVQLKGDQIKSEEAIIMKNKNLEETQEKLYNLNKNLDEKVKERTEEVNKLLMQKDNFINQLGHDLKNPLTPLVNLIPMIEKTETDPVTKETLQVLHRNVDRIKRIVVQTLELAELNKRDHYITFEKLNLHEEVANSINDQKIMYNEKDIKLENNVDKNIIVKAGKVQLNEVFINLLNNAIKYSPIKSKITLDANDDGEFVTISVKDSGIGMTVEQIDNIFDEFYKVDESRHDFDSCGLGLSICKRIIEKHGGKIWVESPGLGKGSTFYFTILSSPKLEKVKIIKN